MEQHFVKFRGDDIAARFHEIFEISIPFDFVTGISGIFG